MAFANNPVQVLTAATATNSPPTLGSATVGFPIHQPCDRATFVLKSTAGSGTMTVTVKLWGYFPAMAEWAPLGVHATAATKGVLNDGNAIAETTTDGIQHAEEIFGLMRCSRIYAEITAIGGTSTAISAWLDCVPCSAVTGG